MQVLAGSRTEEGLLKQFKCEWGWFHPFKFHVRLRQDKIEVCRLQEK